MRSLEPKLKNSVFSAISPAVSAARGTSIMVPNLYVMGTPRASRVAEATARRRGRSHLSSFTCETMGIMISG